MVRVYNKAIRDKIPDIIRNSGRECLVKELSDDVFLAELEKKLFEEVQEYHESKSVLELADIIEVGLRIASLRGVSGEELEVMRMNKVVQRGAFENNFFLVNTSEDE